MPPRGEAEPLQPFVDRPIDATVAALAKADLHVHAEADARLDRVLARRDQTAPTDWRARAAAAIVETPPGEPRLQRWGSDRCRSSDVVDALDADPELFLERIVDLLLEGAADGAVLIEARFGRATVLRPDFMPLFRAAEQRVRERFPGFRAEAVISGLFPRTRPDPHVDPLLNACVRLAKQGLAGVDFIPQPYTSEADWRAVYAWAERLAAAGLGITAHAGEFSSANIAAALRVPGVTRLGHAVYAAGDARLLAELAERRIVVECSLTCNVVLGAVPSYADHPIQVFKDARVPVAICTDDPVRVATTIGREYAIARRLGLSEQDLRDVTQTALAAAFGNAEQTRAG